MSGLQEPTLGLRVPIPGSRGDRGDLLDARRHLSSGARQGHFETEVGKKRPVFIE